MKEIILTSENFKSEVLESDVPVLVDFFATWCGPCMMMAPLIENLAEESNGSYKVGKVNVDEQPVLAAMYGIEVIPTFVSFKDGKATGTAKGVMQKESLLDLII